MLVFIIIVVSFILIKGLFVIFKEEAKIKSQGGMKKKYAFLISYLTHNPRVKIFAESNAYMAIGVSGMAGSQVYHLTHCYNKLEVVMEIKNNPLWGNMKMTWDFPHDMPQEEMVRIMNKDLEAKFSGAIDTFEQMGIPYKGF